jgi:hypothetical protein
MSYLSDRLAAYHITDKENTMKVEAEEPGRFCDFRFFTETDKGDIEINYLTPSGAVEYYTHGNSQTRRFSRIRYAHPEEHKDSKGKPQKYSQEKGTETFPFCTPAAIEAYREGKELKMLFVVEGEFKAFSLSMLRLPTIGIGGVQNFRDTKKSTIHPYITDIIKRCKVQNLILIYDRDCMEVHWEEDKDLAKRLNNFYVALNVFNELLKPYDVQLYFAHVNEKCGQKGIDDALLEPSNDVQTILNELTSFTSGMPNRFYIDTYQVTGMSSYRLKQIFGLANVQNFYDLYQKELQNHDFVYNGITYYIDENGKPVRSWQGAEKHYIRVGTEYYKTIVEKAPNGQTELNLVQWSADTIKNDYSNPKEFIRQIPKFDAFTNIPENDPNLYRQTVYSEKDGYRSVLYNRYCPVSHEPKAGEWRTINMLLHHIFDYPTLKGQTCYEMALDYLQMIYLHPMQHLPILCLVSREQATGKTTFLNLLRAIFKENMRILDSERISSKFNGSWAGKLIIGVDESFIDTDKPTVVNRLKMIATNSSIPIEKKGKEAGEVPNFAKLIMCSNDETNFLKIEIEDTRYWIIRVKGIDPDKRDPHMAERMEAEIPAFLWYLKHRTMFYAERTRLWFDSEDYATEALKKIQERTGNVIWQNIVMVVRQQFEYQLKPQIRLDVKAIQFLMELNKCKAVESRKIHYILEDHNYKTQGVRQFYYRVGYGHDNETDGKGRVYEFDYTDFFTPGEWEELNAKQAENEPF